MDRSSYELVRSLGSTGNDKPTERSPGHANPDTRIVDGLGDTTAGIGRLDIKIEIRDADLCVCAVDIRLEVPGPLAAAGVQGAEEPRRAVVGAPPLINDAEAQGVLRVGWFRPWIHDGFGVVRVVHDVAFFGIAHRVARRQRVQCRDGRAVRCRWVGIEDDLVAFLHPAGVPLDDLSAWQLPGCGRLPTCSRVGRRDFVSPESVTLHAFQNGTVVGPAICASAAGAGAVALVERGCGGFGRAGVFTARG